MTKLISILIILVVLFCGWQLYSYWEKVEAQKEDDRKQAAPVVVGEQLPGMPYQYENSYQAAQRQGSAAIKTWLDTYGSKVDDPRKAWIQLDYCVMIARDNTEEAKRIFAEVKARTKPSSPVYPRVKQLARTYE